MNIPYEGASTAHAYEAFTDNEEVNLELGPTSGPDVTLTFTSVTSVSGPDGPWEGGAQTFTIPDDDPLEVTLNNTAGQQKIFLKIKPNGGLPGGSPV